MKISILMPVYNVPPDLINRAIESVADQSHKDFEIVIKDGYLSRPALATPSTRGLIDSLGSKVKYILGPDGPPESERKVGVFSGYYWAVNQCIRNSSGDILSILCADDERGNANTLNFVNETFQGKSRFCLYGACEWIDRNSNHLEFKSYPEKVTFEIMRENWPIYTPSLFWTRDIHDKFGYFDPENCPWSADVDFWLRCWRDIESMQTSAVIGKYRVWETSHARDNGHYLGQESLATQRRYGRG